MAQPGYAAPRADRGRTLALLAFLVVSAGALTWAKWMPYSHKLAVVLGTHSLGTSILSGNASTPSPSWRAAVGYALAYGQSVWMALVAGLLIAAAVEAFLPAERLLGFFHSEQTTVTGALRGGVLSLPTMLCTCCAAPVTVSLRRQGAPTSPAIAFWLGNPTLNPATLAFMAIVLPWQWVTVRILTGVALVFCVAPLVARLSPSRGRGAFTATDGSAATVAAGPATWGSPLRHFISTLVRLTVTLVPEYLIVLLILGGLRGVLFPVTHGITSWGVIAVVIFVLAGTAFVIPTAGEIPILQGLLAAGVGVGVVGGLLLALPAISLPSIIMVGRAFPARVLAATAAAVVALGLVGSGLLVMLQ